MNVGTQPPTRSPSKLCSSQRATRGLPRQHPNCPTWLMGSPSDANLRKLVKTIGPRHEVPGPDHRPDTWTISPQTVMHQPGSSPHTIPRMCAGGCTKCAQNVDSWQVSWGPGNRSKGRTGTCTLCSRRVAGYKQYGLVRLRSRR